MNLRNTLASEPNEEVLESIEPRSFIIPQDSGKLTKFKKKYPDAVMIAKPKCGSEGNNCLLFKELTNIPSMMSQEIIV